MLLELLLDLVPQCDKEGVCSQSQDGREAGSQRDDPQREAFIRRLGQARRKQQGNICNEQHHEADQLGIGCHPSLVCITKATEKAIPCCHGVSGADPQRSLLPRCRRTPARHSRPSVSFCRSNSVHCGKTSGNEAHLSGPR